MPRTLPWKKGGSSALVITRPQKTSTRLTKPSKRAREEDSGSEGTAKGSGTPFKQKTSARAHSTSPPPEPPTERFMIEGMDHDDKYRMVEDEFLAVAQNWTVHLHATEYKKQQKMVKSRNAETIDAISRPVVDRMPNNTRRKVEGLAKVKAQKSAVGELLAKTGGAQDTDSDEDAIYYGNGLHTLMVSPRKKAASLSKIGSAKATTRAAAGFQKPAPMKAPFTRKALVSSPLSKNNHPPSHVSNQPDLSTASEDEDDDLDAPISAPKLRSVERSRISTAISSSASPFVPSSTSDQMLELKQQSTIVKSNVATTEVAISLTSPTGFDPPRTISNVGWRAKKLEESTSSKGGRGGRTAKEEETRHHTHIHVKALEEEFQNTTLSLCGVI